MFFFCEPISVNQFSKVRLFLEYWLQVEDQALEASELSRWISQLSPKNLCDSPSLACYSLFRICHHFKKKMNK